MAGMKRAQVWLPSILLVLCAGAAAAQPGSAAPGCGTADAVLAHFIEAVGGETAIGQLQTLEIDASATEPHTFNPGSTARSQYRFAWKAPDKVRVSQHYGLTWANYRFDGRAWSLWNGKVSRNEDATPAWQRRLKVLPYNDDPQFLMFRVAANPLPVATTKNLYRRYALRAGAPGTCELEAFGPSLWGERHDALAFDATNGLLKSWAIETGEPGDGAQLRFQFDDYRPAGNILIPRLLSFDFYGTEFRVTGVRVNAPVDDSEFIPRP
jgi:hypothetical protein